MTWNNIEIYVYRYTCVGQAAKEIETALQTWKKIGNVNNDHEGDKTFVVLDLTLKELIASDDHAHNAWQHEIYTHSTYQSSWAEYLGMYMSTTLYFRVAGRRAAVL